MDHTHETDRRAEIEARAYEAPTIADYGDLVEVTAAATPHPTRLDANYPAGATGNLFSVSP